MNMRLLHCLLLLLRTTLSLTFNTREIRAKFDDLSLKTRPSGAIQEYGYLSWPGFSFSAAGINKLVIAGVFPHSPPNYATAHFNQTDVKSQEDMPRESLEPGGGTVGLTAAYQGSAVVFFDFHSIQFGCVVHAPGPHAHLIAIPQNCTLHAWGYRASKFDQRRLSALEKAQLREGDAIAENPREREDSTTQESVEYLTAYASATFLVPLGTTRASMSFAKFGEEFGINPFAAIQTLVFGVDSLVPATLMLDDVRYKTYNVTNWDGIRWLFKESGY